MTFLAPFFLLAALAIAIPILIHFLNLKKPQKIAFSTLSFFKELQKSTIRRLKLKRLLLLSVRILIILMLAFALARPYLPAGWTGSGDSSPILYSFLVDNGIGMDRIDADGPYLDQSKTLITEIISNSRDHDRFILLNTHGEPIRSTILNESQALDALRNLDISATGNLNALRFSELFSLSDSWPGDRKIVYRITTSDGLKRDLNIEQSVLDTFADIPIYYVAIGNDAGSNLLINEVNFSGQLTGPGRPVALEVTVSNRGNQPGFNQFVSLETNGIPGGQHQIDLEPGESSRLIFEMIPSRSGTIPGKILIEGDQFVHDNTHYFSLNIPSTRKILLISDVDEGVASYLDAALSAAEQLQGRISIDRKTSETFIQSGDLLQFDAIILNGLDRVPDNLQEQLVQLVQSGRGLVIFPSERADVISYNQFLNRINAGQISGFRGNYGTFESIARLDRIREGHPIINEIFSKQEQEMVRTTLPSLFYYLIFTPSSQQAYIPILQSDLQEPVLLEHRFGNGRVLLSMVGTDPGWSTFPGNPLFAPVFYRTILYAMAGDRGGISYHELGKNFSGVYSIRGDQITIQGPDSDFLPDVNPNNLGTVNISYDADEWTPGIYNIRTQNEEIHIAANFHISESDFYSLSVDNNSELLAEKFNQFEIFGQKNQSLEEIQAIVGSTGFGSEIWYRFIMAAIILMMLELAISRWYKAESIS